MKDKQVELARIKILEIKQKLLKGESYDICFIEAKEPLKILNAKAREIAKQYGMKHKDINFSSIMRQVEYYKFN